MKASILENFESEDEKDAQDQEQAEKMEQAMEEEPEMSLSGDSVDGVGKPEDEDSVAAARRGERQIKYELTPSKHYVLYIARKNAERYWSKPGLKGPNTNKGCLEVQIALLTEKIRNSILHVREFNHDYLCRWKLVAMVARRRRMLDQLSWKDLDAYLRVRSELKIRHTYRMEVLIGRLGSYKYGVRNRKRAPGRVITMRLKKSKRLLERRLATQLRQGKPSYIIHKTKKKIKSRKWLSRAYDDVNNMVAGKPTTDYVDPLNIP